MFRIIQQFRHLIVGRVEFLTPKRPQSKIGFHIVVALVVFLPLCLVRQALIGKLSILLNMGRLIVAIAHTGPRIKSPDCATEAE